MRHVQTACFGVRRSDEWSALALDARALVPVFEPALVVCSGDTKRVPEQLARAGHWMLVLHAVSERSTTDEPD